MSVGNISKALIKRSHRITLDLQGRTRPFSTTFSSHQWGIPRPDLGKLPIDIHPEVLQAQSEGRSIVALESTLITHGLPPPHSFDLPQECEHILRSQGVTPATIAILDGRIKVGLTPAELQGLAEKAFSARTEGSDVGSRLWKVGRRELAAALIHKVDGGTTVSGTMAIAHLANIKIFSTGGIGGVHRGAETSFDISSDLISLSDTPVAVICAGSKSILDIGLTLEYLEAHAIPVAAYGTLDWPAFYAPVSGFKAPMRLVNPLQVAETILMTDNLQLPSSLLLGVPIPSEHHEAGKEIHHAVEQAVRESVENGMSRSGKGVTPWLLERVGQLTKGKAIVSNKALIKNNVKVGGEIALEYAKLLRESREQKIEPSQSSGSKGLFQPDLSFLSALASNAAEKPQLSTTPKSQVRVAVVGALAIDITMVPASSPSLTTAPGKVILSLGGVAGNVSGASRGLGIEDVLLIAPVASDSLGTLARSLLKGRGMRDDGLVLPKGTEGTASCGILLNEHGELVGGVADMDCAENMPAGPILALVKEHEPQMICFDANLSEQTIACIIEYSQRKAIPTFFEPTSDVKALRLLKALSSLPLHETNPSQERQQPYVTYAAPNLFELQKLHSLMRLDEENPRYEAGSWFDCINVSSDSLSTFLPESICREGIPQMAIQLLPIFGALFVKLGGRGALVVQRVSGIDSVAAWKLKKRTKGMVVSLSSNRLDEAVVLKYYEGLQLDEKEVKSVTGAGDNMVGAILACISMGLQPDRPDDLDKIMEIGQKAAINTLRSKEAVGDHTSLRNLLMSSP